VIVGAGPVGATLALALREADLEVVALDARPRGGSTRGDRSLALSHGTRLVFERLGIWAEVASGTDAVTPIAAIDISQRGGFGRVRLDSAEHDLPALGYVVSYRALQAALDSALERSRIAVEHDVDVARVDATPAFAEVRAKRRGEDVQWTTRLAAVADGGGGVVSSLRRRRHDYRQVALVARVWMQHAHRGVAFERFTPEGPMALLPEGDHYGLVWTATPERAKELIELPEAQFLAALAASFGPRVQGFARVTERRSFALALDVADHVVGERIVLVGNAAQALHPVAGQGFNLGIRDAFELAQELLATPPDQIGAHARLAEYARRRRPDRWSGISFTHGLLGIFGADSSLLRWPRGLALTLLDALPPVKRAFTRAMLYGLH
jgi:2-octaprenyl-6-methoxyphenol hydroxylase